jgi:PAS domain S-box-containing protein
MLGARPAVRPIGDPEDVGEGSPARESASPPAVSAKAAAQAERRRHIARRDPSEDRLSLSGMEAGDGSAMLPRTSRYLVLVIPGAVAFNAAMARTVPPAAALAFFVLSIAGFCALPLARRIEARPDGGALRKAGLALAILVPLLLFAVGANLWNRLGTLPTPAFICMLIGVGAVAGAHLRRQAGLIVGGQIALWMPASGMTTLPFALTLLLLGIAAALIATREQHKLDSADLQRRLARERAQTRARDILADYEETGQGWFWETDRRSQLTYVSIPVAALLGLDHEALIGRPLTELFDLGEVQEGERTLLFHLSARSAFHELPVKAASGEERWWSVSGRPIYDQFDNFVGFRGSGTDLTEKRRS